MLTGQLISLLKKKFGGYLGNEIYDNLEWIQYINMGLTYIESYKDWSFLVEAAELIPVGDTSQNIKTFTYEKELYDFLIIQGKNSAGQTYTLNQTSYPTKEKDFALLGNNILVYGDWVELQIVANVGLPKVETIEDGLPVSDKFLGPLYDRVAAYAVEKQIDTGYTLSNIYVSRADKTLDLLAKKHSTKNGPKGVGSGETLSFR